MRTVGCHVRFLLEVGFLARSFIGNDVAKFGEFYVNILNHCDLRSLLTFEMAAILNMPLSLFSYVWFVLCVMQAARRQPSSTAQTYNSLSGKKQFDNQRNLSTVCTGIQAQAFGTIAASELASLQGKK